MNLILLSCILYSLINQSIQQSSRHNSQVHIPRTSCPISDNPSQVFQCLTLNPQAFVDLISKNDFKSFCHMANGYMTCMSTYIRDCLLGKAASGILEELQDLNLKCCISGKTDECIIKSNWLNQWFYHFCIRIKIWSFFLDPTLLQKCFSTDNTVRLSDGSEKSVMNVELGDVVKAIDSNGNVIDSEIISIMHKDSQKEGNFKINIDKRF